MDVCTALPAASVAQLTGVPVTKAEKGDAVRTGVPLTLPSCNYTGGGTNQLHITYEKSQWLEVLWDGARYKLDGVSKVPVPSAKQVLTALHAKA